MSIHYGHHGPAARYIISLMGTRRSLKIERPTVVSYRGWYGRQSRSYAAWLRKEKARIAAIPRNPEADRKKWSQNAHSVKPGECFRLIDGHGKAYGPRFTAPTDLVDSMARVRVVQRQEEDLHSVASRMLKRAHRDAMKD